MTPRNYLKFLTPPQPSCRSASHWNTSWILVNMDQTHLSILPKPCPFCFREACHHAVTQIRNVTHLLGAPPTQAPIRADSNATHSSIRMVPDVI